MRAERKLIWTRRKAEEPLGSRLAWAGGSVGYESTAIADAALFRRLLQATEGKKGEGKREEKRREEKRRKEKSACVCIDRQ